MVSAVEVAHLAGADIGGPHGQPGVLAVDPLEIHKLAQRRLQQPRVVVAGGFRPERNMRPHEGHRVGLEEGRNAGGDGEHAGDQRAEHRHRAKQAVQRAMLHAAPEFLETREPVAGLAARDQAGVDGADRSADHPVGLDAGLVQRLVDADLVGTQRPATLEDQHALAETARHLGVPGRCPAPREPV